MGSRKEFTKYHNDLNLVGTTGWTEEEQNFFFAVITRARDNGTQEIELSKSELLKLAGYNTDRHTGRLRGTLERLVKHVSGIRFFKSTETVFEAIPLFYKFRIEWNGTDFRAFIRLADDYEYILNELHANFTSFELLEFTEVRGTYAKTLYRLMKQYRQTGERYFTVEEFRALLGVPATYKAGNVQQKVIGPAVKELSSVFHDLEYKTIKGSTKGNPVKGYQFTWTPSKASHWQDPAEYKAQNKGLPAWYGDTGSNERISENDLQAILKLQEDVFKQANEEAKAQGYEVLERLHKV